MKIIFLDAYTTNHGDLDWKELFLLGDVQVFDRTNKSEIVKRAIEAEIIITNKVLFTEEIFRELPNLKYICVAATGYNNIDLKSAAAHGVIVSNVVGYSTSSVAQHVFSLILTLMNRSWSYSEEFHQQLWSKNPDFSYFHDPIMELKGMNLGIYGLGKIGKAVARIGLAFEMNVLAVHKHPERDKMNGVSFVDWDQLIQKSDVLSLHAPLTNENAGKVNSNVFNKMKKSAYLINTSRGPVINEQDLSDALKDGLIAGAGVDVLCAEPPSMEHPLIGIKNCIVTPHHAWASQPARKRLLNGIIENISSFMEGRPLNVVS